METVHYKIVHGVWRRCRFFALDGTATGGDLYDREVAVGVAAQPGASADNPDSGGRVASSSSDRWASGTGV